ncbi:uncharacterized protein LOC131029314 isoform X1 [Cryptomeria japonica]|uniref:uncharacterized protein LOC131029314 isoform X1 n=1 Tax=Cryptomeria japonica TaxID=3369 RepID=UPI0027DA8414|nr:uncharacterized protein LOC131029314 isoform X1 [Cryptomeria japonica]
MKSPPSPLQSPGKCHQKLALEPLYLQVGGGTKLLGYGERLSVLCEYGAKYGKVRCTVGKKSSKKGFESNNIRNVSLLSKLYAATQSSSVDIFPEEEEEDIDDDLSRFRGLVLDLYYRPINVVCWKRAICLEFLEKADVLQYYEQTVSSPGGSFNIPAVLKLASFAYVPKQRHVRMQLSRKNIYHRDLFTCQYCGSEDDLTIDHIFPVSRGGKWSWENLVTACNECNWRKSDKTLEEAGMKLTRIPKAPKDYHVSRLPVTRSTFKMLMNQERLPNEWTGYISSQI